MADAAADKAEDAKDAAADVAEAADKAEDAKDVVEDAVQ